MDKSALNSDAAGELNFNIIHFESLTSTLDEAAKAAYIGGEVIVAKMQTAGRGQRGSKWIAQAGQNLTFTLVVAPKHIKVVHQFSISMMAALAVVRALKDSGIKATVKWPNDIYVGDSKICGILIEHSFSSEFLSKSIIGVGINVAQTEFDPALPNPTSIKLLGVDITTDTILELFLTHFKSLYNLNPAQLLPILMDCLYRRRGFFQYKDAAGRFAAQIEAIDPHSGEITLKDSDGNARKYLFKQVQYM